MEFLGKTVKKQLTGNGVCSGVVKSYNESSRLFEIGYEDGNSEELELSELNCLLEAGTGVEPAQVKRRPGRKPKKRRRVQLTNTEVGDESGNSNSNCCNQIIPETLGSDVRDCNGNVGVISKVDLNDGLVRDLGEGGVASGSTENAIVDLNEDAEKASGVEVNVEGSVYANGSVNGNGALDLNCGFNFNLNDGFDLNEENADDPGGLEKTQCIDLNLDVNDRRDDTSPELGMDTNQIDGERTKCSFDLNLGVEEEVKDDVDGECGVLVWQNTSNEMFGEKTEKMDVSGALERSHSDFDNANGTLQEVPVINDSCLELAKGIWKKDIVTGQELRSSGSVEVQDLKLVKEDSPEVIDGNQVHVRSAIKEGSSGRRRGRRRLNDVDNLNTPETTPFAGKTEIYGTCNDVSAYKEASVLRRGRSRGNHVNTLNSTPDTPVNENTHAIQVDCTTQNDGDQVDEGSAYKEAMGSHKKRRRLSGSVNVMQETTVLRRSSRRGSVKIDSSTITVSAVNGSLNEYSVSPSVSGITKEKTLKSCRKWPDEPVILPAMVQLPASSQKLDLSGMSVVDLFSVYSCLRSFSTILYLSPFELEDFVAALRCTFPSSLLDCIHVSILRTLKKHLEFLSNEGVESASVCLRSLNWGFLDLVTWPIFMVEYILIQDLDLKPGYSLSNLELLKNDYYKQPVSVKVEILRCLCDGIVEIEAIRSELNRRSSGAEFDMDFERNMNPVSSRKTRNLTDMSGGSNLMEETLEDTADGNIDECCLCKMDGSLICCDGCPAAYHSKCVGVVSDSLPDGDWFCPECAIDRNKPWMKYRSSIRGAELLGVDPYGRLYFGSCGYLLVSDSSENKSPFSYYHRDELNAVIRVLRSSEMVYGSILEAIHKHWDIPVSLYGETGNVDISNHYRSLEACMLPAFSEMCTMNSEIADGRKPVEKLVAGGTSDVNIEASKSVNQTCVSSEGSAETTQTSLTFQNFPKEGSTFPNKSNEFLHESDMRGNLPPVGDKSLDLCSKNSLGTNGGTSGVHMGTGYMNYYSFGYIASLIAEELLRKPSEKSTDNTMKTEEEKISTQMKIMSKICPKFHWSNTPIQSFDVQKEKCGWCFTCRGASDDLSCLFNISFSFVHEGPENGVICLHPKSNKEGHLADIISHILGVEKRLLGLLSGPWLNPHYSSLWRKSVLAASDIESVKRMLLTLVSNVRHLALSAEWLKHVDSSITIGSASHIIMASSRASSKKRARQSEFDSGPSSSVSGLAMLWWRGGRISRRLFNWKVLPRCLVSKAARQAGCVKIPGMLYHENSDFAKRSKCIAWRAAVESSTTAEQLALQVREFDSNIRWDEIEKATSLCLVDKEFKKSVRLFKKVVVRRKSVEGDGTKYLLDFGKRRSIPEIVLKNGSVVEESSSERKKYWLNESSVPLYVLKSFEEKRVARKSSKPSSGKLSDASLAMKRPSKKRGFSYLFDKAERSQYHQCGHCNKNVPIRDAVCCQYCQGFFHIRHVRKSAGSVAAQRTYTCHKCAGAKTGKTANIVTKAAEIRKAAKIVAKSVETKGKRGRKPNKMKAGQLENSEKASVRAVQLTNIKRTLRSSRLQKNNKVTVVVPLRRSPRKVKYISSQSRKVGRSKKTKKAAKPKKATYKKRQPEVISWKKKRTQAYRSYWLNGLLLSRKPDDARVKQFRRKRFLAPSESIIRDQPRCRLCSEAGYRSASTYISCEICGEWSHGDAYGLGEDNKNMLMGFRCHMCRKCSPPICPFVSDAKIEPTNDTPLVSESDLLQESYVNEVHQDPVPVDKEQLELDEDVIATTNVDVDAVMTEVGPIARDDGNSTGGGKSVDIDSAISKKQGSEEGNN